MSDTRVKEWPNAIDYAIGYINGEIDFRSVKHELDYEHARAEAALSRLMVAVDALENIGASANGSSAVPGHKNYNPWGIANSCIEEALAALETIGDLPKD